MKKIITFVLVGVLAFGVLGPATAKKKAKKPVPVDLQFFMRRDDCATDADNPHLSLTDAEDADCFGGASMLNEVLGKEATAELYPAADGVPVKLDPTRKVTGSISMRNWNGAGAGNVDVDLELIALIGGEEKPVGTFSTSYIAVPAQTEVIPYEMDLDPAVAGAVAEGLTLSVYHHGVNVGIAGGIEHDDPVSFITIPALK